MKRRKRLKNTTDRDKLLRLATLLILMALLPAGGSMAAPRGAEPDAPAAGYTLGWWSVDGGGATWNSGGGYVLGGAAGQPDAGTLSGGEFTLRGGLWGATAPGGELCNPVANVLLLRRPGGDLFTGDRVSFAAIADGTIPFTHTWTLDGTPVGENQSTFDHTFDSAGSYAVGVVVDNACGQGSSTMTVEVQERSLQQPDLSQSNKSASLASVESGDILTYTLYLHNSWAVVAAATLADPIPAYTAYLTGSAQASDGAPVTVVDGQLDWSGEIVSGTPVIVSFAVEVQAAPLGTAITNAANLDDGLGNVVVLAAASTYNPGYGLTIDEGALYTNIPTVTLRYSWDTADGITQIKISNDGGFGPGGNTTAWLAVDAQDPTYANWVLATYGSLTLPRTVYAKFRDASGQQYGPVQDEIIYDPDAPRIVVVEIVPQVGRGNGTAQGQNVLVRVTASDANSGVGKVQISNRADFGAFVEFPFSGPMTGVVWVLQPSGLVHVRVVDRAGNLSAVSSAQGPVRFEVYLPIVLRGASTP
jgi:uncharacterized repeat protein (TIGR01451 family)